MAKGTKNVLWAQCERCEKWRSLPKGTTVDQSKPWYCNMNPDRKRNACSIKEESYDDEDDVELSSGEESQPRALSKGKQSGKLSVKGKSGGVKKGGSSGGASGSGYKNGYYSHDYGRQRSKDSERKYSGTDVGYRGIEPGAKQGSGGLAALLPRPTHPGVRGPSVGVGGGRPLPAAAGGAAPPRPLSPEIEAGPDGSKAMAPFKGARGITKARKAHSAFQKLMSSGGLWSIAKGRGRTVTAPPLWMWEGMATFAPECAMIAAEGADLASAAKYFEATPPGERSQGQQAGTLGRLSMVLASAIAARECERVPGVLDGPSDAAISPAQNLAVTGDVASRPVSAAAAQAKPSPSPGRVKPDPHAPQGPGGPSGPGVSGSAGITNGAGVPGHAGVTNPPGVSGPAGITNASGASGPAGGTNGPGVGGPMGVTNGRGRGVAADLYPPGSSTQAPGPNPGAYSQPPPASSAAPYAHPAMYGHPPVIAQRPANPPAPPNGHGPHAPHQPMPAANPSGAQAPQQAMLAANPSGVQAPHQAMPPGNPNGAYVPQQATPLVNSTGQPRPPAPGQGSQTLSYPPHLVPPYVRPDSHPGQPSAGAATYPSQLQQPTHPQPTASHPGYAPQGSTPAHSATSHPSHAPQGSTPAHPATPHPGYGPPSAHPAASQPSYAAQGPTPAHPPTSHPVNPPQGSTPAHPVTSHPGHAPQGSTPAHPGYALQGSTPAQHPPPPTHSMGNPAQNTLRPPAGMAQPPAHPASSLPYAAQNAKGAVPLQAGGAGVRPPAVYPYSGPPMSGNSLASLLPNPFANMAFMQMASLGHPMAGFGLPPSAAALQMAAGLMSRLGGPAGAPPPVTVPRGASPVGGWPNACGTPSPAGPAAAQPLPATPGGAQQRPASTPAYPSPASTTAYPGGPQRLPPVAAHPSPASTQGQAEQGGGWSAAGGAQGSGAGSAAASPSKLPMGGMQCPASTPAYPSSASTTAYPGGPQRPPPVPAHPSPASTQGQAEQGGGWSAAGGAQGSGVGSAAASPSKLPNGGIPAGHPPAKPAQNGQA